MSEPKAVSSGTSTSDGINGIALLGFFVMIVVSVIYGIITGIVLAIRSFKDDCKKQRIKEACDLPKSMKTAWYVIGGLFLVFAMVLMMSQ